MPSNAYPPEAREAALADVRAGGKSLTQIAKDHNIPKGTISKWVKAAGITNAFDRSPTEAATRANVIDARARRVQLQSDLLDDAQRLRKRAWSRYEVVTENRQAGPQTITLDLPPAQDVRAFYAAIGIAADKSMRLEQYDNTGSDADAKSMIGDLAEGIRKWAQANPDPEEADPES